MLGGSRRRWGDVGEFLFGFEDVLTWPGQTEVFARCAFLGRRIRLQVFYVVL